MVWDSHLASVRGRSGQHKQWHLRAVQLAVGSPILDAKGKIVFAAKVVQQITLV